jgi:O-antigen/teichoic acid export membrane protein
MYDTGFTLNAIRGVLTSLIILAGAHPVASFFGDSRLTYILWALALAMLLSSLENIGIVDFNRELAFDKEFKLFVVPRIAGIVVGMTTAWFWPSYWALVVVIFTTRVLRMAFTYAMHPYRPGLTIRAWRRMLAFSTWSWVLAVTLLIRDRIDAFVIGRMLGPTQVGIYSIAWEIGFAPTVELVAPFCRALFPSFSALRNREGDIADAYFRAVSAAMLVTMPASLGIALIADPLVRLAFGERWIGAIPVMQIFALVGVLRVSAIVSSTLLRVYGLQQVQVHITWVSLVVRLAFAIVLVSRFGLIGGAFAAVASVLIEEAGMLLATFRRFRLRAVDLLLSNWRCGLASVAMTAAVLAVQYYQGTLPGGARAGFGNMAFDVLAGAASYTTVLLAAWLAAGQPRGAETYVMDVMRQAMRVLRARRGLIR